MISLQSDGQDGRIRQRLRLPKPSTLFASAFVMVLGTGLFTMLPVPFPVICLAVLASMSLDRNWRSRPFVHLPAHRIGGVLILSCVYLGNTLAGRMDFMDLTSAMYGLTGFTLAHALISLASHHEGVAFQAGMSRWAVMALLVLGAGQVAQLTGVLALQNAGTGDEVNRFILRPGGFHNPNMTAALALLLFEILLFASTGKGRWLRIPGGLTLVAIIVLAQSRAPSLFLGLRWLLVTLQGGLSRRTLIWLATAVGAALVAGVVTSLSGDGNLILETFFARFSGDDSSDERGRLFLLGLEAFSQSPWWGNGYHHLMQIVDLSSHNEFVENLVNWGVLGSIPVWIAFALIYGTRNPGIWLAGIAPSLLFSHNFFTTLSLQVLLGILIGADHAQHHRNRFDRVTET